VLAERTAWVRVLAERTAWVRVLAERTAWVRVLAVLAERASARQLVRARTTPVPLAFLRSRYVCQTVPLASSMGNATPRIASMRFAAMTLVTVNASHATSVPRPGPALGNKRVSPSAVAHPAPMPAWSVAVLVAAPQTVLIPIARPSVIQLHIASARRKVRPAWPVTERAPARTR
jgi:hypothetical protein